MEVMRQLAAGACDCVPEDERMWVKSGAGCAAAGLVVSVLTKNWSWFAVGATTGAVIVGLRLYSKSATCGCGGDCKMQTADKYRPRAAGSNRYRMEKKESPCDFQEQLGAPMLDPMDNGPANKPRKLKKSEVCGYPVKQRRISERMVPPTPATETPPPTTPAEAAAPEPVKELKARMTTWIHGVAGSPLRHVWTASEVSDDMGALAGLVKPE